MFVIFLVERSIPIYRWLFTMSSFLPCNLKSNPVGKLFRTMTLLLLILNAIWLIFDHNSQIKINFCSLSGVSEISNRSSANPKPDILMLPTLAPKLEALSDLRRSSKKMINNMGPSLLPCKTPDLVLNSLEYLLLIKTLARLLVYKSLMTLNILPLMPNLYNFLNSISRGTLSNAFIKSRKQRNKDSFFRPPRGPTLLNLYSKKSSCNMRRLSKVDLLWRYAF